MLKDNVYISDDEFLKPSYRISPFRTRDLSNNAKLKNSNISIQYLNNRFINRNYILTTSGRNALYKSLVDIELNKDDVVTILTTTNNYYISGCVTREIEKFCKWSRKFEENTRAILLNHEFGFPIENLADYRKYNLPIIEDCAHSFVSQNKDRNVGQIGDYVIYSLPKFFPVQFGGILVSSKELNQEVSDDEARYLFNMISHNISNVDDIINIRVNNYNYLSNRLGELGFETRLKLEGGYCPGVFIFNSSDMDLGSLKNFMQNHGVECSVFYGEESFFLPVNQSLNQADLDYFVSLIEIFRNEEMKHGY